MARAPVAFEMTTCSQPGAFWDVSIRKIIVCYELTIDYADLHRGYAEHEIAPPSRKSPSTRNGAEGEIEAASSGS